MMEAIGGLDHLLLPAHFDKAQGHGAGIDP
jgi:hypothetical protein